MASKVIEQKFEEQFKEMSNEDLKSLIMAGAAEFDRREKENQSRLEELRNYGRDIAATFGVEHKPAAAEDDGSTPVRRRGRGRRSGSTNGKWTLRSGTLHLLKKKASKIDDLVERFKDELDYETTKTSLYVSGVNKLMKEKMVVRGKNGYELTERGEKEARK